MGKLLYEEISEDLEQKIQKGMLKENDRLSERKLALDYNVSRTVIREAFKVLNEQGLIETRSGAGSYVTRPSQTEVKNIFTNAVKNSCVSMNKVVEARELFESSMTDIIIERVTEEELEQLSRHFIFMQKEIENGTVFARLDEEFHCMLMKCTKNELLELFMNALNDMMDRTIILSDRSVRENAQKEHQQMIEAIYKKDSVFLKETFRNHISCIREAMEDRLAR